MEYSKNNINDKHNIILLIQLIKQVKFNMINLHENIKYQINIITEIEKFMTNTITTNSIASYTTNDTTNDTTSDTNSTNHINNDIIYYLVSIKSFMCISNQNKILNVENENLNILLLQFLNNN